MNEIQFRELVGKMLSVQQKYFKSRLQGDLVEAKQLEKRGRAELEAGPDQPVDATQPGLFGQENIEQ